MQRPPIGDDGFFWASRPIDEDRSAAYRIVRTPAKGKLTGVILSTDLVGHRTHYYEGRTQPCIASPCEACEKGRRSEWKGWLWFQLSRTDEVCVLELPTSAAFAFEIALSKRRSLRGLQIETSRRNGKTNGRVAVNIIGEEGNDLRFPTTPKIHDFLRTIWRMREVVPQSIDVDPHSVMTEGEHVAAKGPLKRSRSRFAPSAAARELHYAIVGELAKEVNGVH